MMRLKRVMLHSQTDLADGYNKSGWRTDGERSSGNVVESLTLLPSGQVLLVDRTQSGARVAKIIGASLVRMCDVADDAPVGDEAGTVAEVRRGPGRPPKVLPTVA